MLQVDMASDALQKCVQAMAFDFPTLHDAKFNISDPVKFTHSCFWQTKECGSILRDESSVYFNVTAKHL